MPDLILIRPLEFDPQAELDLTVGQDRLLNSPGGACGDSFIGQTEIGTVEDVEKFGPKLHIHIFSDRRVLGKRQVHIGHSGCDQGAPSHIAYGI